MCSDAMSGNPFEPDGGNPFEEDEDDGLNPFGEIVIPSLDHDLDTVVSNPFKSDNGDNGTHTEGTASNSLAAEDFERNFRQK